MTEKALVAHVRGRVQGVGYRAWTVREAQRLGLRGTVRNLGDGSVEAVIAGSAEDVDQMIERFRAGPRGASVTGVETRDLDPGQVPAGLRILA